MADYIISGSAVSTGSFGRLESIDGIAIGPNSSNKLVPTRKFYVSTATHNTFTINAGSGDATLQLTRGDSEQYYIQHETGGLNFKYYQGFGGSYPSWMFVNNSLNVGIGTTSPSKTFHAYANVSSDYVALVENDQATSGHGLQVHSDGNGSGTILFDVDAAGSSRFRVKGDGSVLVGFTTSQAEKLAVQGDFKATGNISGSVTSTGSFGHIKTDSSVVFKNGGGYTAPQSIRGAGNILVFQGGTAGFYFNDDNNANTNMAIGSSGRVSIGHTSAPSNSARVGIAGNLNVGNGQASSIVYFENSGTDMYIEGNASKLNIGSVGNTQAVTFPAGGGIQMNAGNVSGSSDSTGSFGHIVTNGHIVPTAAESFDLGSETKPFRDLHVSSGSIKMYAGSTEIARIQVSDDDEFEFFSTKGLSAEQKKTFTKAEIRSNATPGKFRGGNIGIAGSSTGSFAKVGIGTTDPVYKLHISSSDEKTIQFDRTGQETYRLTHGTSGLFFTKPNSIGVAYGVTQDGDFHTYDASGNVMFKSDASSGNIGIGDTSPEAKLTVKGTANSYKTFFGDTSDTVKVGIYTQTSSPAKGSIGTQTNHPLGLIAGDADRVTILTSGNVGIGTINPGVKLDVQHGGTTEATLKATSSGRARLNLDANSDIAEIYFKQSGTNKGAIYQSADGLKLHIYKFNPGQEIMSFVYSNRYVGIKNTSPSYELDVSGTIRALGGNLFLSGGNSVKNVNNNLLLDAASGNYIALRPNNGTEAVRILSDGNVGIGTNVAPEALTIGTIGGGKNIAVSIYSIFGTTIGGLHTITGFNAKAHPSSQNRVDIGNTHASAGYAYTKHAGYSTGITFHTLGASVTAGTNITTANERMRITGAGLVGIGTSSPSKLLHLGASSGYAEMRLSGTSGGGTLEFYNGSTALGDVYFDTNKKFYIRTNGATTALTIDASQNVGIGTTAPTSLLDVRAESAAYLTVRSDDSHAILQIMADNDSAQSGNFNPSIRMYTGNSTKYWQIYGNDATTEFKIDYNSSNGFKMDSSRNVTIPQNLTVGGTITAQEFRTEFNTEVVIETSGSTKFGNTAGDDKHQFTGSIDVSGSITLNGSSVTSGGGGGGGISFNGSTANGLVTFGDSTTADVESALTFNGYTLQNTVAGDATIKARSSVNSSGNDAVVEVNVAGTSAGDPFMRYNIDNVGAWLVGVDNSDSDKFKIAGLSTALGTNDRLVIDTSGNVGINDTTPTAQLDITTSAAGKFGLQVNNNSGNQIFAVYNSGGQDAIINIGNDGGATKIQLNADGSSYFNGGDVAIGHTTPQVKLDVVHDDGEMSHFGQASTTNGKFSGISLGYRESNLNYRKTAIVQEQIGDGAARGHMHFLVDTGNDAGSAVIADSKMMIHGTSGNVGMGITAPVGRLHLKSTGSSPSGSIAIQHSGNTVNIIEIGQSDNGNAGGAIVMDKANGVKSVHIDSHGKSYFNGGNVGFGTEADADTTVHIRETDDVYLTLESQNTGVTKEVAIKYQNYSTGTDFWWVGLNQSDDYSIAYGSGFTGANAKLMILSNGNVGIGLADPAYTLEVKKAVTGDWLSRIYNTATTTNPSGLLVRVDDADSTGMIFGANASGTYRFVVKPEGMVGIGTASPESLAGSSLHIRQSSTDASINLDDKGHYHLVLQNNDGSAATGRHVGIMMQINSNSQAAEASIYTEFEENGGAKLHFTTTKSGTGQERMVIDSDGMVGIGTASPSTSRRLHIHNTDDTRGIYVYNSSATSYAEIHIQANREYRIGTGGASSAAEAQNKFYIYDATAAAHRFTVDSSGNVGIGTVSPGTKLEIGTRGTASDPPTTAADGLQFDFYNAGNPYPRKGSIIANSADTSESKLAFWTAAASSTITEKMTILGNGNVGIGTKSPGKKFVVETTTDYDGILVRDTNDVVRLFNGGANDGYIQLLHGNAVKSTIHSNGNTYFTGGNVGIGKTNPSTKLDVAGSGAFSGIVTHSSTSNFVGNVGIGDIAGAAGGKLLFVDAADGTADNNDVARFRNQEATAGRNYGVSIIAGSNSTDNSLHVMDKSSNSSLIVRGDGNVGIGVTNPSSKLQVNGKFSATSKSFLIDHPTKKGKKLQYGSLEGPENGVYVRGKLEGDVIELPDYWVGLVHEDSITVNLTPIGKYQHLYVEDIKDNKVFVKCVGGDVKCFYTIYGERKDIEKLKVEF